MTRTGLILLSAVALVGATFLAAPVSAQPELDGVYIARGIDFDGSEYLRAVEVVRQGERFIVIWMSPRILGETLVLELASVGVGLVSGKVLAVSYLAETGVGVVAYEIGQDGQELVGRWTVDGADAEVRSETLTRVREPIAEPAGDPPTPAPLSQQAPRRQALAPAADTASLPIGGAYVHPYAGGVASDIGGR